MAQSRAAAAAAGPGGAGGNSSAAGPLLRKRIDDFAAKLLGQETPDTDYLGKSSETVYLNRTTPDAYGTTQNNCMLSIYNRLMLLKRQLLQNTRTLPELEADFDSLYAEYRSAKQPPILGTGIGGKYMRAYTSVYRVTSAK